MNFKDQSTYKLLSILSKLARNSSEASRKNFANKLAAFIYNFFPFRKNERINVSISSLKKGSNVDVENFIAKTTV